MLKNYSRTQKTYLQFSAIFFLHFSLFVLEFVMAGEQHQIPTAHVTKDHEEGHQHDHHTMSEFLEKKEEQKPTDELSVNDFVKDHVSKSEEMKEQQEHNPSFADDHNLDRSTNIDSSGDVTHPEGTEEKKGFMEKIKEKLPGGHKKTTDEGVAPAVEHHHPTETNIHQGDYAGEEKKGFMEKIKEKLPGHHKSVE